MTDLDRLIEAVECGNLSEYHDPGQFKALPFRCWTRSASAYRGSLDAAKALHEALLPGWGCCRTMSANGGRCSAEVFPGEHGQPNRQSATAASEARAWLISILKAYRRLQ